MYKLPEFFLDLKQVISSFDLPKPLQIELFGECLKTYGYWYYYQRLPANFETALKTLYIQAKPDLDGFDEFFKQVFNVFKTYYFV
jgi:hypothetical protein